MVQRFMYAIIWNRIYKMFRDYFSDRFLIPRAEIGGTSHLPDLDYWIDRISWK